MRFGIVAAALLASTTSLAGCGDDNATPDPTTAAKTAPALPNAGDALDRAIAWASDHLDEVDPFTLVVYDHLYRRYDIEEFAAARDIARTEVDSAGATPELRLIDASARVDPAVFTAPDSYPPGLLIAGALACDEPGRPDEYERWLRDAISVGGYDLTHAAVAISIERDLGCEATGGDELRGAIVDALSAAVARDDRVDDVAVERMAMLVHLGEIDRIPLGRIDALLGAQRSDGSYASDEANFEAHTTALAIWVLGAIVERDEGRDPQATPLVVTN